MKSCAICQTSFAVDPNRPWQLYCSPACRRKADAERKKRRRAGLEPPAQKRLTPLEVKRCPACEATKALSEFRIDRAKASGRYSYCRACESNKRQSKGLRLSDASGKYGKEYMAQWRANHPGYGARWRAAHPAHREDVAQWRKDHPEHIQKYRIGRRLQSPEQFVEYVSLDAIYERDKGLCGICGKALNRVVAIGDHIIPLSKGGLHNYANVQLAHPSCNSKKGTRVIGLLTT